MLREKKWMENSPLDIMKRYKNEMTKNLTGSNLFDDKIHPKEVQEFLCLYTKSFFAIHQHKQKI